MILREEKEVLPFSSGGGGFDASKNNETIGKSKNERRLI